MTRRICVFTSTRADYGLLYWLIHDLHHDAEVELQLLVSGSHLCPQFGETWKPIVADGFPIAARVEMVLDSDTGTGMATSLGLGTIKYAEALARLAPDILVVLGDRYELLAVAAAAMCLRIPIAHIHGGESTEGLIDEPVRHAVTAMSQIHFPAADLFARRIVQMGNDPDRVFPIGAPGIDNLDRLELPTREALEADLGFSLADPLLVVVYHPVTLSDEPPARLVGELLSALEQFPQARIVISRANQDAGGREVNQAVDAWAKPRADRVLAVTSLGMKRYLALLKAASVVIGNSSSGIIEAPPAGAAVVNVGDRQKGRPQAPAIINCPEEAAAIAAAITRALAPDFQAIAKRRETPYGRGAVSERMAHVLRTIPLDGLIRKSFHDLPEVR